MEPQLSPIPAAYSDSSSPTMELSNDKPAQDSSPQPLSPIESCESTATTEGSVVDAGTAAKTQPSNPNVCRTVMLNGVPIASLVIDGHERLCLAQISNTLLKDYSYNEIHNRRVALGVTCVQCTPVQLEILRRAGAMPISSRRCGMITKREAERLCKSFLEETLPPKLPENFAFDVYHVCAWGCRGSFIPSRYNSSRAKCIKCAYCNIYFSPNKFIFHSHRTPESKYNHPDAANFNSWRRHIKLTTKESLSDLTHAWEDVKAMFNGGSRKRVMGNASHHHGHGQSSSSSNQMSSFGFGMANPPPEKRSRVDYERSVLHNTMRRPFGYPLMPVPNKTYSVQGESLLPKKTDHVAVTPPYSGLDLVTKKHLSPTGFKRGLPDFVWGGGKEPYNSWNKAFGININGYYQQSPNTNTNLYKTQHFPQSHLSPDRNKVSSPVKLTSPLANSFETERRGDDKFSPWDSEIRKKHSGEDKTDDVSDPKVHFLRETHEYVSAFKPVTRDRHGGPNNQPALPTDLSLHGGNRLDSTDAELTTNYDHKRDRKMITSDLDEDATSGDDGENDIDVIDEDQDTTRMAMAETSSECDRQTIKDKGEMEDEENDPTQDTGRSQSQRIPTSPSALSSIEANAQNSVPTVQIHPQISRPISCDLTSPDKSPCVELASSKSAASGFVHQTESGANQDDSRYAITSPPSLDLPGVCNMSSLDGTKTENSDTRYLTASPKNTTESGIGDMEKEDLEKALLQEMRMRKKMEQECQLLKDTFQNQVKRELAYREEMSQQLQIVRETLCHELDAERKARYAIQQKLKGDELTSQQRRPQPSVDPRLDMDRTLAYWRLAMLGPACLPTQQWRAMMPIVMNGETPETGNETIFPASAVGAGRVPPRSLEIYGNNRRTSAF